MGREAGEIVAACKEQVGDIYCCSAVDLLKSLKPGSVGAIITDPPFHVSVGRAQNWSQPRGVGADPWTEITTIDEIIEWTKPHVEQCGRVLRPGGALAVMGGTQSLIGWDLLAPRFGFQWMAELIVLWNMGKPRLRNFGSLHTRVVWYCRTGLRHTFNSEARSIYSNVLVCSKVPLDERRHPSEKPVGLTNFLVSLLSKENDLIVDPFCGAGSTLVSATQCQRPFLGGDELATYVTSAKHRLLYADEEYAAPVYLWVNGRMEEV